MTSRLPLRDLAAWLLCVVTLAEWWGRLIHGVLPIDYGSADIIAIQTVIEDVLVRGNPYRGAWYMTPAPYFFPDGVFALLARAFTSRPEVLLPSTAAMQFVALCGAAWFALRVVGRELSWLGPTVVSLVTLAGLDGATPMKWLMFPVHHLGAVIVLLLVSACLVRGRAVAALALLVLGAASDGLLAAGAAPALLALSVWAWRAQSEVALRFRRVAPAALVAVIVGTQLTRVLVSFPVHDTAQVLRLERVVATLSSMWSDLITWPLLSKLAAVVTVTGWLASLRWQRRSVFALWNLAGVGMVAATIATANVADGGWQRYVMWPVLAAVFSIAVLLPRVAALGALLAVALLVRPGGWASPFVAPTSWWRPATECLERLAEQERAPVVVADYWRTKPLMFFTTKGLMVTPLQASAEELSLWIMSRHWVGPADQVALVVTDGLDVASLDAQFGVPAEIVRCESLEVRVYRDEGRARLAAGYDRWVRDAGLR